MKHKRMTLLFVLVTFAGSPPMWQKLGNFVAAVQHKAQIKFLSMVLNSGDDAKTSEVSTTPITPTELIASSSEATPARVRADVTSGKAANLRKAGSDQNAVANSEAHRVFAVNAIEKDDNREALSHLFTLLPEAPTPSTAPAVASVPRAWLSDKNNFVQFVELPQSDSIVPVRIDNPALRLKIKKALEDNRSRRQRTRFVIGRPLIAPASSENDAPAGERAG